MTSGFQAIEMSEIKGELDKEIEEVKGIVEKALRGGGYDVLFINKEMILIRVKR